MFLAYSLPNITLFFGGVALPGDAIPPPPPPPPLSLYGQLLLFRNTALSVGFSVMFVACLGGWLYNKKQKRERAERRERRRMEWRLEIERCVTSLHHRISIHAHPSASNYHTFLSHLQSPRRRHRPSP